MTETCQTDALVKRHQDETDALLRKLHTQGELREHSIRQARELLDHAFDLEKRLHAMWQEHRWCGKS